ncbi:MAG: hypothetical protein WBJ30_05930, partial [Tepidanaerobacteraceae bacterium]
GPELRRVSRSYAASCREPVSVRPARCPCSAWPKFKNDNGLTNGSVCRLLHQAKNCSEKDV